MFWKQKHSVDLNCSLWCVLCLVTRCKESHPTPKLSQEELDSIAEIKESVKERAKVFCDMEAFLPKKNGWGLSSNTNGCFCIWDVWLIMDSAPPLLQVVPQPRPRKRQRHASQQAVKVSHDTTWAPPTHHPPPTLSPLPVHIRFMFLCLTTAGQSVSPCFILISVGCIYFNSSMKHHWTQWKVEYKNKGTL